MDIFEPFADGDVDLMNLEVTSQTLASHTMPLFANKLIREKEISTIE